MQQTKRDAFLFACAACALVAALLFVEATMFGWVVR